MAFFSGLDAGNRSAGGAISFLPVKEPLETILESSKLLREADACVGSLASNGWVKAFTERKKRCINLGQWSEIRGLTTVGVDYRQVGLLAAESLIEAGVLEIWVIAPASQWRSVELFRGVESLKRSERGLRVNWGPSADPKALQVWLAGLEAGRSHGVIAINDAVARRVIELAGDLDLSIGEDLRVVGVGNNPEASLLSPVSIASVPIPYYAIGRRVAECLINPWPDSERCSFLLDPEPLVHRESLGLRYAHDAVVERAMDLMRRSLKNPYGIDELARSLGVSRRSLELKFESSGLQSPAKVWMGFRLDEAKRLLRETDWLLYEIAERSGFSSQQRFSQVFRDYIGVSASAWRSSVL